MHVNTVTDDASVSLLTRLYLDPNYTVADIANILEVKPHTVMNRAQKLGLHRPKQKPPHALSDLHEALLREHYEYGDLDQLCNLMGKNRHAVGELARRRGLYRQVSCHRQGDLTRLIDGSLESFYWLGYLAADGYIHESGHLMFSQGERDKASVYQFADYVKSTVYEYNESGGYNDKLRPTYRVAVLDDIIGKQIRDMWGLQPGDKKTYKAITYSFLETKEQCQAFLVGFFDGDGSLNKAGHAGRIEVHSAWLDVLAYLMQKCEFACVPKINKRGYADVYIKKIYMPTLYQFCKDNGIRPNTRKWSLLD
jgi:hypothetical protein